MTGSVNDFTLHFLDRLLNVAVDIFLQMLLAFCDILFDLRIGLFTNFLSKSNTVLVLTQEIKHLVLSDFAKVVQIIIGNFGMNARMMIGAIILEVFILIHDLNFSLSDLNGWLA